MVVDHTNDKIANQVSINDKDSQVLATAMQVTYSSVCANDVLVRNNERISVMQDVPKAINTYVLCVVCKLKQLISAQPIMRMCMQSSVASAHMYVNIVIVTIGFCVVDSLQSLLHRNKC